ncbi:phage gp6-like head-tail connector protein [Phyllobacterium salinisoli]|uniref:Phage gp6-like head-tail connector protein n=1 Tax=Phyllobacterium salinisoli TaxID=1899321 RepID=A0A368KCM9_9HYPH|nr:head-tail connector protein [Phyllobacterium salinisoli]RCS25840.1 phage gp6-like head-tail connector protein [Phyllobacterium salinisoli]
MIVDLETVKQQLGVTLDIDDAMIERKIRAAQDHVERLLGYKIEETFQPDAVPPSLVEAVCQLTAHWYENREAAIVGVNAQDLPLGLEDIVREYRGWTF